MNDPLRVVLDTNVIVSAMLAQNTVSFQAFTKAYETGTILMSWDVAGELFEVIQRPKFDRYITRHKRLQFLSVVISISELVTVSTTITDCRDPKDNKFLALAVDGQADYLISGDKDLLTLHPFRGIPIFRPDQFLTQT